MTCTTRIGWETSHNGPLRVWIVGLSAGSTIIGMNNQSLRYAFMSAFYILTGMKFEGGADDFMIQYYWASEGKQPMLVITEKTAGRPWYEVCDLMDKGAYLEVYEDGWVRLGKILGYEWIGGMLCLKTPMRAERREKEDHGKWTCMAPNPAPFVIDPCLLYPIKDTKGLYDFQLRRPGAWAVIRPDAPTD